MNDLVDLLVKIRRINSIMVKASTNKYAKMEQLEIEYQKLRKDLSGYFDLSHASNANGFVSLQEFFGYCRANLPHWEQRRAFQRGMYGDIERSLEAAIRNSAKIGKWTIPQVSAAPKIRAR